MSKVTAKASEEFTWPAPDVSRLKAAVDGPVHEFVPDGTLYASCTTEGPPEVEITYDSIEEWLAGISLDADRVWASFSNYAIGRSVDFSWRPAEATVRISVGTPAGESTKDAALGLLQSLAAAVGLTRTNPQQAELIFAPRGSDSAWIEPAVRLARKITGHAGRFTGSWQEGDVKRETKVEAEWLKTAQRARRWDGEWRGFGNRIRIEYRAD